MAILAGTASWAEKSLIDSGLFYPPDVKTPEARLRYYASVFPLVELDSSYYAIPSQANARRWVERTPPGFTMNVKAFRFLTGHQTETKVLPAGVRDLVANQERILYRTAGQAVQDAVWDAFLMSLEPLRAAGRLGLVHFQFPPAVVPAPRAIAHVERCVSMLRPAVVSVEFRHRSWWAGADRIEETLAWLRRLGAVHTVVDGPQGADNSVPVVGETTHPEIALVRLHGRNVTSYNAPAPTAAERFDYDYPDHELQGLVAESLGLAYKARNVHLIFNNCSRDQGQRNAITAMRMATELAGKGPDLSSEAASNGMLGRIGGADLAAAMTYLPPAGASAPEFVDVDMLYEMHGRVRVTFRQHKSPHHGKSVHVFWTPCFARPL